MSCIEMSMYRIVVYRNVGASKCLYRNVVYRIIVYRNVGIPTNYPRCQISKHLGHFMMNEGYSQFVSLVA